MDVFHVSLSKPPKRDVQLKIMVSADEKDRLDALAKQTEMTSSDIVRIAVNDFAKRLSNRKKK
jgi:predicted transcriptional regulator